LFILPDFFSPGSSKTDEIGFAQNQIDKPIKLVGLSISHLVYRFSSKFLPI
jgi:hypothetical protein